MLTARRLQERRAAEAAGLPPPAPPLPEFVPRAEHERLFNELRTAHGQELAAARAGNPDSARFEFMGEQYTVETLAARIVLAEREIADRFGELERQLTEAREQAETAEAKVVELERETAELNGLLESYTKEPAPAVSGEAPVAAAPPADQTPPEPAAAAPAPEAPSDPKATDEAKGKKKQK